MSPERSFGPLGPDFSLLAMHTLYEAIDGKSSMKLPESNNSALDSPSPPLFCTFNIRRSGNDFDLRGCIGTLAKPSRKSMRQAICDYAIIAGQQDSRFDPVDTLEELKQMSCTISLLTEEVPIDKWDNWEVGTHGTTIEFKGDNGRGQFSATYLPEVASEMQWSKSEAIASLVSKAGYRGSGSNNTRGGCRNFTIDEEWIREHELTVCTYESKKSGPITFDVLEEYCRQ